MSNYNLKLIVADGFYDTDAATKIKYAISNLQWVEKSYGEELENFNLIQPNMDYMFSRILDEPIDIDENISGVFRRSMRTIHFEDFESLNEWCFVVALEKCTFNVYKHISDGNGEVGNIDARSALDGYTFNYKNFFEWNIETNIVLEPGQGIFFRPWIFHNIDGGLVQYYRLKSNKKNKEKTTILVMGLPGSGKTTFSKLLSDELNASNINADEVRKMYSDSDFSIDGRLNQANRMRKLANISTSDFVICDFVCPLQMTRDIFDADYVIWMNTIDKSRYNDTNMLFEPPSKFDLEINTFDYNIKSIASIIWEKTNQYHIKQDISIN